MSRIAWIPAPRTSLELYEQIEVPEPGEPGYPGPELPADDPRAGTVNQVRAEIETGYAYAQADVNDIWDGPEPDAEAEI
ncbi:MAG: hypothetical protein M3Z75_06565 [Actinomycetota bacterium]|nr:hypothetical protein [Actinomycetota bacterium]